MDTLQPLEEIDLSFPAQPSSSSTFIHSHNNVMASSHKSTDTPIEKEEEGVKTEPQEEALERQRFVAVVIPAKRPSSSSDNENTMRVKAKLAEAVVKKEEQEDDEYMESEDEEASLASSSRPGFLAASSATNTIVKPYNARGDELFSFLLFLFQSTIQSMQSIQSMYN